MRFETLKYQKTKNIDISDIIRLNSYNLMYYIYAL